MKESKSSTSKMINRNWVLKRKRRKLSFDHSNGKADNSVPSESSRNASAKRPLKTEVATGQFSSKKKGNDGVSCLLFDSLVTCTCEGLTSR